MPLKIKFTKPMFFSALVVLEGDLVWQFRKNLFCYKTEKSLCSQLKIMEQLSLLNCQKY